MVLYSTPIYTVRTLPHVIVGFLGGFHSRLSSSLWAVILSTRGAIFVSSSGFLPSSGPGSVHFSGGGAVGVGLPSSKASEAVDCFLSIVTVAVSLSVLLFSLVNSTFLWTDIFLAGVSSIVTWLMTTLLSNKCDEIKLHKWSGSNNAVQIELVKLGSLHHINQNKLSRQSCLDPVLLLVRVGWCVRWE